jgi:hypothetical protein
VKASPERSTLAWYSAALATMTVAPHESQRDEWMQIAK